MLSVITHLNSLKFVMPAAVMMGSAPPYFIMFGGLRVVSCILPERWWRAADDWMWGTYQRLVEFFFENYTGLELVLYGDVDTFDRPENAIYMCNHQTTLDWVVANMVAIRCGMLGHMRFVLKDGLKYLPLYGFVFGQHGGVYVKRAKTFDGRNAVRFHKKLEVLCKKDIPTWMVIFPEGTRYNPCNAKLIRASQAFAFKNGLAVTNHVLSPRVKAVSMCVQGLRGHTSAVYDVTIAYSNTGEEGSSLETVERRQAPGMPDFLQSRYPQIHIHLRRIPMETVPENEEACHRWLHELFEEKDNMLSDFYSNDPEKRGRLEGKGHSSRLSLLSTLPALAFSCAMLVPMLSTSYGRQIYWKTWLFGSIAGIAYMKLTT